MLTNGGLLEAKMHFEVLDRGASQGAHRYKVSTRAYLYAICAPSGEELYAAHWHPGSKSPVAFPHYHLGAAALAPTGVFLARAHIPSPRISFESVVRLAIESGAADPACDDWQGRLDRTEGLFEEHKTWP